MTLKARWNGLLKRSPETGVVGFEISLSQMHFAQLSRSDDGLRLSAHHSINHHSNPSTVWQDTGHFKTLVRQALKAGPFRGKRCVAALPAALTRVMPISYQASGNEEDSDSIAKLVIERLGDDAANMVIDYMPVETLQQTGTKLALVALCREETVVDYLDALRNAGLDVVALEIGPIAIQRLVNTLMADLPAQNTLVVNCGRERSYLTLMADSRLLADDEIPFGEDRIIDTLCNSLDIDAQLARRMLAGTNLDPEAKRTERGNSVTEDSTIEIVYPEFEKLAKEIERGLIYANSESRGSRRSSVYLLGGIARWPGAERLLQSILNVPVSLAPSPLALFGEATTSGATELAVATGLALHSFDKSAVINHTEAA